MPATCGSNVRLQSSAAFSQSEVTDAMMLAVALSVGASLIRLLRPHLQVSSLDQIPQRSRIHFQMVRIARRSSRVRSLVDSRIQSSEIALRIVWIFHSSSCSSALAALSVGASAGLPLILNNFNQFILALKDIRAARTGRLRHGYLPRVAAFISQHTFRWVVRHLNFYNVIGSLCSK